MLSAFSQYNIARSLSNKEPLYIVKLERAAEIKYEFIADSFPCERVILCGGNPGMITYNIFGGSIRGLILPEEFKDWKIISAKRL